MMMMVNLSKAQSYFVQFCVTLTALIMGIYIIMPDNFIGKGAVLTSLTQPFEICEDTKVVKPGGLVKYKIHYKKSLDIPGDLAKQLVLKTKTGELMYITLSSFSGHLEVGEVKNVGLALIPDWTPEGIGYIKLSASYNLGWKIDRNVSITDKFEIRR
jgi:hypothetical protein